MAEAPTALGWYADPCERHELRFFDGRRWTDHIADRGVLGRDGSTPEVHSRLARQLAPPSVPSTGPRRTRWWGTAVFVVTFGVIGVTTLADELTSGAVAVPSPSARVAAADPDGIYAVRDPVKTAGFVVTVESVELARALSPANHRVISIELTVASTSDKEQVLSVLAGAELADASGRTWRPVPDGFGRTAVGGTVAPRGTHRGWLVYVVPDDASGLTLRVKGSFVAPAASIRI
jgi:hypothetical protein